MFQGRQNFFSALPPVTKNLIIINFLVWLATIVLPKFGINLVEYLGLHYLTAKDFNAVQLVTYMFMHDPGSIGHVFFNMFSVFMFGRTLEMVWGSKRFLTYYMITGFGTFSINEKGERTGINPATKQQITIPAKKVVKFKAGAELADKVK